MCVSIDSSKANGGPDSIAVGYSAETTADNTLAIGYGAKERMKRLKDLKDTAKEKAKEEHIGFMAQDVQKVFPECVKKDKKGFLGLRSNFYERELIFTMFQAIKELDTTLQNLIKRVDDLCKKVDNLAKQYNEYNKRLNKIEQRLNKLERRTK